MFFVRVRELSDDAKWPYWLKRQQPLMNTLEIYTHKHCTQTQRKIMTWQTPQRWPLVVACYCSGRHDDNVFQALNKRRRNTPRLIFFFFNAPVSASLRQQTFKVGAGRCLDDKHGPSDFTVGHRFPCVGTGSAPAAAGVVLVTLQRWSEMNYVCRTWLRALRTQSARRGSLAVWLAYSSEYTSETQEITQVKPWSKRYCTRVECRTQVNCMQNNEAISSIICHNHQVTELDTAAKWQRVCHLCCVTVWYVCFDYM